MAFVPLSGQAVFDQGDLIDGALLYAYDAGTDTPRNLFTTSALDPTRVHPIPVIAGGGVLPVMFAGAGGYDLHIFDPTGALIRVVAGLPGEEVAAAATGTFNPLAQPQTGDIIISHRTGNRTGWVRCNGGSIGSSASSGTERANDDCHALFVFLWTQDATALQLMVSGGRGSAGAEADWAANKTISLPNAQNRALIGVGDMGNAGTQASITGALAPNGTVLGAIGGEAVHTLTGPEVGSAATGATGSAQNVVGGTVTAHNNLPPFLAETLYMKL